jgi:predicted aldo/keto reductase-like oxidoreductase
MKDQVLSRRTFVGQTLGTVLAGPPLLASLTPYNTRGLPTAVLGKTGVTVPRIALGLGSRFCTIEDPDQAVALLTFALDQGLCYWDTAHIYENKQNKAVSEERMGRVVAHRRREIFLSTKVTSRDPDEAMRQIEGSLRRLRTDQVDILKIHSVASLEDVDQMSRPGRLVDIVSRMKEQGVTRFIGFSGHGNAEAMQTLARRGDFDTMLIAMNHWGNQKTPQPRQELAVPAALAQGMGVMLMKAIRPRDTIAGIDPRDLIRFALSLEGPAGVVVGVDSPEVVESNLSILRTFQPMDASEKQIMARRLSPFFRHEHLEWMQPGYRDGNWA